MSYECEFMPRIKRSRKWKDYARVCYRFARYLDSTEEKKLRVSGYDTVHCVRISRDVPYIHRFCNVYASSLYAKFSQLQTWYHDHETPVFLMTLTTSNKGKTIKEAFDELRDGWHGLTHCIRNLRVKYGIDVEYIYVYEPHKSGYPHMHVVLFGDLTDLDFERIKLLWSKKYKVGSYEHGVNISAPRKQQEIEYVRAYILKYVQKTMDFENMSPSQFVFLAVMWSFYDKSQWSYKIPYWTASGKFSPKSTGGGVFRLWGASRSLTAVMQKRDTEFDGTGYGVNYARFGEEIPDIVQDISEKQLKKYLSLEAGANVAGFET